MVLRHLSRSDAKTLFVAFYASAELELLPRSKLAQARATFLDLFAEFRDRTNGLSTPAGAGLTWRFDLYFGLDGIGAIEKDDMQQAIGDGTWQGRFHRIRNAPASCSIARADVLALEHLLTAMSPRIDLTRTSSGAVYGRRCRHGVEWNANRAQLNLRVCGHIGPVFKRI